MSPSHFGEYRVHEAVDVHCNGASVRYRIRLNTSSVRVSDDPVQGVSRSPPSAVNFVGATADSVVSTPTQSRGVLLRKRGHHPRRPPTPASIDATWRWAAAITTAWQPIRAAFG